MRSVLEAVQSLSPASQQAVRALVRQLCENEGVVLPSGDAPRLESLAEGIEPWIAYLVSQGFSPRSVKLYVSCVNGFLRCGLSATALDIQRYLAHLRSGGMSVAGVKNQLKSLKSLFRFLSGNGLWPGDPTRNIKTPRERRTEVRPPTQDEVSRILAAVNSPKLRVALILMADSGFRFGELATLGWDRVDLEKRQANVVGKGDKERTVPLSVVSCAALRWLRETTSDGRDLVFPSRSARGWDNRNVNKALGRYCAKAGVRKCTCHQFRHFFATQMLQHGADLKTVSEILGHTDPSTTVKFYAHTDGTRIRNEHSLHSPLAHPVRTEPHGLETGLGEPGRIVGDWVGLFPAGRRTC